MFMKILYDSINMEPLHTNVINCKENEYRGCNVVECRGRWPRVFRRQSQDPYGQKLLFLFAADPVMTSGIGCGDSNETYCCVIA